MTNQLIQLSYFLPGFILVLCKLESFEELILTSVNIGIFIINLSVN